MKQRKPSAIPLVLILCATFFIAGCGANQPAGAPPDTSAPADPQQTDTGTYQGRIDSSSVEITLSGVPDPMAARAFFLSDAAKEALDKEEPEAGAVLRFQFTVNDSDQYVLETFELLEGGE